MVNFKGAGNALNSVAIRSVIAKNSDNTIAEELNANRETAVRKSKDQFLKVCCLK